MIENIHKSETRSVGSLPSVDVGSDMRASEVWGVSNPINSDFIEWFGPRKSTTVSINNPMRAMGDDMDRISISDQLSAINVDFGDVEMSSTLPPSPAPRPLSKVVVELISAADVPPGMAVHVDAYLHEKRQNEVLRMQLKKLGHEPVEYIPMEKLKGELAELLSAVSAAADRTTAAKLVRESPKSSTSSERVSGTPDSDQSDKSVQSSTRSSETPERRTIAGQEQRKASIFVTAGRGRGRQQGREKNWREAQETTIGSIPRTMAGIEARIEYLMACMEVNPEHNPEEDLARRQWKDNNMAFLNECLATMRAFVPLNIYSSSIDELMRQGLSKSLARRIYMTKALWLLRLTPNDISKIHASELSAVYATHGLDIIELGALCRVRNEVDIYSH